jgi:hypothetical protein
VSAFAIAWGAALLACSASMIVEAHDQRKGESLFLCLVGVGVGWWGVWFVARGLGLPS